jgi:hypothetical protein
MIQLFNRTLSPFEQGEKAGLEGAPAPEFPTPDSDWASRLYHRGWQCGAGKRQKGKPHAQ